MQDAQDFLGVFFLILGGFILATSQFTAAHEMLQLPGLLVSPRWLATHLNHPDLCMLDARLNDSFVQAHIPGAIPVDLRAFVTSINGVDGMLLPQQAFAALVASLGIGSDKTVIVYDDHWGMPAARILWSFTTYGHARIAVLNGGWDRWQEEGQPTTVDHTPPEPAQFAANRQDEHLATLDYLRSQQHDPATVLVDCRSAAEYAQGHIPGAVNWDWMNGVPLAGWETMRPPEALQAELAQLGITPDKQVITYCRSGARSAHTYLLLRALGYPTVRNYDGSWLEWSAVTHGGTTSLEASHDQQA